MSDEEHEFHGGDAGASETYPSQAGNLKKGGYIVINERPCKVLLFSLPFLIIHSSSFSRPFFFSRF